MYPAYIHVCTYIYVYITYIYGITYMYIYTPCYPPGLDTSYTSMLKEVSSQRNVNVRPFVSVHLMYLSDSQRLIPEQEVPRYDSKVAHVFF